MITRLMVMSVHGFFIRALKKALSSWLKCRLVLFVSYRLFLYLHDQQKIPSLDYIVPFRIGRSAGDWLKQTNTLETSVQQVEQSDTEQCKHIKYFANKIPTCYENMYTINNES